MENQNQYSREDRFMKALAIVGFVVVVILLAWLAVQVVRVLPGAFASLARLAEDVNTPHQEISLDVTASNNVVNSESSIEITWSDLLVPGTYEFTYECVDGVTANVRTSRGEILPLSCETPYTVESDAFALDIQFASEQARFTDVSYRITFTPDDEEDDSSETSKTLTVVNASIPLAGIEPEDEEEAPVTDEPDTTPSEPVEPPVYYRTVETRTYTTPTSDPNGYTELAVTYMGVGTINSQNRFVAESELEEGERGAFQFEVKNTGTKTSGTWSFEAELPNDSEYDSKPQDVLKPQERSIVTVAFSGLESGKETFGVTIEGGDDQTSGNNSFSKSVTVAR